MAQSITYMQSWKINLKNLLDIIPTLEDAVMDSPHTFQNIVFRKFLNSYSEELWKTLFEKCPR